MAVGSLSLSLAVVLLGSFLIVETESASTLDFQTSHKFGFIATIYYWKERFQDLKLPANNREGKPRARIQPHVTSPTVVVVRDLFDATVSGYLYHKTGHECWLDHLGKENSKKRPFQRINWLENHNWRKSISKVPLPMAEDGETVLFPRNICRALEAANETIGIGIYLEWARQNFFQAAAKLKSTDDPTLFVCFEDLTMHPNETESLIRSFHKSHQENTTAKTETGNHRRLTDHHDHGENKNSYSGGHATDHNPELRARLRAIAMDIDCAYFGCETKIWNDSFHCTSEAERKKKKTSIGTNNILKQLRIVSLVQWMLIALFCVRCYIVPPKQKGRKRRPRRISAQITS